MFGLLNVNKPAGPTSHDIVFRVRRMLPRGVKVGHTGTLDPFACGVMVVCVGPATRLADCLSDEPKQYLAEVTLGFTSASGDTETPATPTGTPPPADEAAIRAVLPQFLGTIDQTPPAHSAIWIDGKRAYKLIRGDKPVEMPVRQVRIDRLELVSYREGKLVLRVDCGGGTYIRALARDIGEALGCGGYCSALTRTKVGAFTLEDAVALPELSPESLSHRLLSPHLALAGWPTVTLDAQQVAEFRLGRGVRLAQPPAALADPNRVSAIDESGRLIALCRWDALAKKLRPAKVFAE